MTDPSCVVSGVCVVSTLAVVDPTVDYQVAKWLQTDAGLRYHHLYRLCSSSSPGSPQDGLAVKTSVLMAQPASTEQINLGASMRFIALPS